MVRLTLFLVHLAPLAAEDACLFDDAYLGVALEHLLASLVEEVHVCGERSLDGQVARSVKLRVLGKVVLVGPFNLQKVRLWLYLLCSVISYREGYFPSRHSRK